MRRLDFYVQHMLKQSASGIAMRSGDPVEFRFANGKVRRSNQPISHKQVIQLVREVAPPDANAALQRGGRTKFSTDSEGGSTVYVAVDASGGEVWHIEVSTTEIADSAEEPPAQREDEWDAFPQQNEDSGPRFSQPDNDMEAFAEPGRRAAGGAPPPPQARQQAAARGAPPARPQATPPQRKPVPSGRPPAPPPAPAFTAPPAAPPAPPAPALGKAPQQHRPPNPVAEARLQKYLRIMLQVRASDLHLSSGAEPMVRVDGEMRVLDGSTGPLRPDDLFDMMMAIAPPDVRRIFEETNEADFAYELESYGRFRMNYFVDRRGPGIVSRQIPFDVVSPEHLGIPASVTELCWLSKGLVLVTGPTGSGKSTTLASLIDFINRNRADHIITIEDPIEYVHPNKRCLVNQRQVGLHTQSFAQALRAALREDPDIVVVGEMRDLETISIAIETAETGHLVFGTLHTTTAPSTVDRVIDQFPAEEQSHIRSMLAESLKGVISQVLCKKMGGGRVAAYETLLVTSAAQNLIREGKTFQLKSLMQTGRAMGMQTMNDHLFDMVRANLIDVKDAYVKAYDKQGLREQLQKARINIDPALLRGMD
jgi:twitching motility protein PilT